MQNPSRSRETYFHEDDYCQQQLLPCEATAHAASEIGKIDAFADAHRAPGNSGWTDMYLRPEAPVQFCTLKIKSADFAAIISPILPAFDAVFTGYSSHREVCKRTAAWGISEECALYADWDDDATVANVWTRFLDPADDSIRTAAKAVAALGRHHPLVFVDWAWSYTCHASDEERFAALLRNKLEAIEARLKEIQKG